MLSDRAEKTSEVVVLTASLGDPSTPPPGLYRVGFLATCGSIFAFFAGLVVCYIWRAQSATYWQPIQLPPILRLSTTVIFLSSVTFEVARRLYRRGERPTYKKLMVLTTLLTLCFLALQITAWVDLFRAGSIPLAESPQLVLLYLHRPPCGARRWRIGGLGYRASRSGRRGVKSLTWWPITGTFYLYCGLGLYATLASFRSY